MKSILQADTEYCIECGRYGTELHHVLFGKGNNRKLAERYGLTVGLCYYHHRASKTGVHGGNRELDLKLKRMAQVRFEETYTDKDFLATFGRNYL